MTGPMPENRKLTLGVSLSTAALCIAFGANAVAIKICLEEMGSFTLAGTRFALAALTITLWARATGKSFRLKQGQPRQLLLLSTGFAIQIALFYLGLDRTSASRGTLVSNLQPFLVLLLAHFFLPDDRINLRKFSGITLGFLGVASLFISDEGVTSTIRAGDLIVLLAVVAWAAMAVYIKRIIHDYEPFQVTVFPMYLVAPVLLAAGFLWDGPMIGELDLRIVGGLLYQSFVTASFGFVLWNTLQKRHGAVAMHSYVFLVPIAGVSLGGLLLDEPVATVGVLTALGLIVIGIFVVNTTGRASLQKL